MLSVLQGDYWPGRNAADPFSRHPSFLAIIISTDIITAELAHLSLCSVTNSDTVPENNEAAAVNIASHTANLDIYQGLYCKGDALVVPYSPEGKHSIARNSA